MFRPPSGLSLPLSSRHLSLVSSAAIAMTLSGCGGVVGVLTGAGSSTPATAVANGPQLGYVWYAKDQTLRPILGVPGSSQVGTSVVPAGAYVNAASSSPANLAVLIGADQKVYRMSLPGGTPSQINAQAGDGSVIRFSPSGTAALLYVPGSTSATVLTGLTTTPTVRQVTVPAPILDLAASDAGTAVAILQASSGANVAVLATSGTKQIATLHGSGGLSFAGVGEDVIVADSAANSLTLIKSASTTPSPVLLATSGLLKSPTAVGASLSGRWVAVANAGESSVVRVDVTGTSAAQRVVCPNQPTLVAQLAGNGVFRFNDLGSAPVWVSDVTASSPSMLFVPTLPGTTTEAGAH
jgi:hypothetical protein